MRFSSRPGRLLWWAGLVLMALPLPVVATTEGLSHVDMGDFDDVLEAVGFFSPLVGFALIAAGRLRKRVAADGKQTLGARFVRAPGLRWFSGFAKMLLETSYLTVLGTAVAMLIMAGLTAALSDASFTFDEQPMGFVGDGIMALGLSTLLATAAWLVLGFLVYAGLELGHAVWALASRSSSGEDKFNAGMIMLSVLVVAGIVAIVIAGNAGVPAGNHLLRGAIATGGVFLLAAGLGPAMAIQSKQGAGPWGTWGAPQSVAAWFAVGIRVVAGLALLGWLVTAMVSAWSP